MEEEIRQPDAAKIDRLISNNNYQSYCSYGSEDDDDFEFQYAILESKRMAKEREERAKHFAGFLSKIKRFYKIDKSNESFYLKLIEYIELYELEEVEMVNVGREFYMKFEHTINNMRITADEKSRLYQFIRL
jgi:hypothetical protein